MSSNLRKRPASLQESTPPQYKRAAVASTSELPRRTSVNQQHSRTNDDIHSSIDLCPITKLLLDTRPVQRLRGVQQLATAQYVYVNCTHNRLEHSLGVAHLAEQLCRRIAERQPQLKITPKDILCVKLAGLMHDLGHGPFSHTYEDFLKKELPQYLERHPELKKLYVNEGLPSIPPKYKHENTSLKLIDAALESRGLKIDLENLDKPLKEIEGSYDPKLAASLKVSDQGEDAILTSRDFVFIKECINGKPIKEINTKLGRPKEDFVGRPEPRSRWLYDVINNKRNGLDVDKLDYYARDYRAAMKGSGEIDKPMILEAVVAQGTSPKDNKKHLMICYPRKVVSAAMQFFKQRHSLHKTIYRHKKNDAVGHMVCDILCHADPFFRLTVPGSKPLPISRAMLDTEAFLRLKDSILDMIGNSQDPRLDKAKELLRRLEEGAYYKLALEQSIDMNNKVHEEIWKETIKVNGEDKEFPREERAEEIKKELIQVGLDSRNADENGVVLNEEDIIVDCVSIHCGSKSNNPVSNMRFLEKNDLKDLQKPTEQLPVAKEVDEKEYEADIPKVFCENSIRVFCRDPSKVERAQFVFEQWWVDHPAKGLQTTPPRKGPSNRMKTTMVSPVPLRSGGLDD